MALGSDNIREFRTPDFLLLRCQFIIQGNKINIEPLTTPKPALSAEQDALLRAIHENQRKFGAAKLVISRHGGEIYVDEKPTGQSILAEVPVSAERFEVLVDSMPDAYLRRIPDFLLDNPFVVSLTDEGRRYLGTT